MHRRDSKLVKSHGRAYSVAHLDSIATLPGREEFDAAIKVLQQKVGDRNGKIGVVQKDGIIYASKTIPTPTIAVKYDIICICIFFMFKSTKYLFLINYLYKLFANDTK